MLMLLFSVDGQSLAVESSHAVEVIPKVNLSAIAHSPEYVAGMLNFRGMPVPVVDLCQLISGTPCKERLHTRIVIIRYSFSDQETHTFGLAAENLTETIYCSKEDFIDPGVRVPLVPYLGGVLTKNDRSIQLLLLDILYDILQPELFAKK